MSAYMTYVISGKNSRGNIVKVEVRALSKPPQEVAEWLLRERYPSAGEISVSIPAAHGYPKKEAAPIKVPDLSTIPVRRRKAG